MSFDIINKTNTNELVINWHITEVCNYSCEYCFAKWGKPNELHKSHHAIEMLLDEMANYFIRGKPALREKLGYEHVRLNLAGGEPMLLGNTFTNILIMAKEKGFRTSIITNGSYLFSEGERLPQDSLDMIGISFDSQNFEVRKKVGRIDRKGNSLDSVQLKQVIQKLRQTQSGLKTKINTVVNSLNWQEDFSALINELKPDKWKVLQVLPYGNDGLLISSSQFKQFIARHANKSLPISPESNLAMTESYLMIDPKGRFYQNRKDKAGYVYSGCINDVGIAKALQQINFSTEVFKLRYVNQSRLIELSEVM